MPFLNYLVKGMKKKQHKFCLIICTVVFSLWRSFLPFATTLNPEGGNSILWFFVLYLYGAYIKLYGTKRDYSHPFLISFGFLLFAYASRIGIGLISSLMGWGEKGTSLFTEFTSFPILFSAVFLLIWANSTKTLKSSHVVWFSSSTFSVYLIHENIYIKRIIYRLFDIQSMAQSPLLLFWILLTAVGVFLCCCVIDKGFVSLLLKWLSGKKLFDKLQKKLDTILIGG